MSDIRRLLTSIAELPLHEPVRVLCLSGDQERVIALSQVRELLPAKVSLVPGPGCIASACPEQDVYQAMRLVERHDVTLLVGENLIRLPLSAPHDRPANLFALAGQGADVRAVEAPIQAVMAAHAQPERKMVYFVAGFETLLAPLAGMVLEGIPDNLSLLLCGRRVEPLLEQLLAANADAFDGLLLPGNRCALTGTEDWARLSAAYRKPAAVAGYSVANILTALHSVLVQHVRGSARVDNHYRMLVRPRGSMFALDQLDRVFQHDDGDWRGVGAIQGTAYKLRHPYRDNDADVRFPDYRAELPVGQSRMPAGCECGDVLTGRKLPAECPLFSASCSPRSPHGPCMASDEGTCFLHRNTLRVA